MFFRNSKVAGNIVIIAITSYDLKTPISILRSNLTLSLLQQASHDGYAVVLVDSGSPLALLEKYQKLGAKVYRQKEGKMGEGRQ